MAFPQITVQGNLSQDPTSGDFDDGGSWLRFSMAVDVERKRKDADQKPPPMWITVFTRGHLAEALANVAKGNRLIVSGTLTRSSYLANNGEERETWTLNADHAHGPIAPPDRPAQQQQSAPPRPARRAPEPPPPEDDFADDIPF